mgnify:CR=1 FL=1
MTIMVRDLPAEERPREKLLRSGAAALSNVELLAILLRTGTRQHSVLRVSEEVLAHYKDRGISGIVHMAPTELSQINGVGLAKAASILAAVELGRRLSQAAAARIEVVHGPEDAAHYAMPRFRFEQREHFAVLLLNTKNHITDSQCISIGALDAATANPREVFNAAIKNMAAGVILVHNHPSGDSTPSREDIAVTQRMTNAGQILNIPLLDHIIIAKYGGCSLKKRGLI